MADQTLEKKGPYETASAEVKSNPEAGLGSSGGDDAAHNDAVDMLRLGKKQEYKRKYDFLAALGWISIYMATWEFVLVSLGLALPNGGFAGLFWVYIGTVTCYSTIVASLAEMCSIAPTSGGQYHWVSEFAPPKYQKILSYSSGWMSTLGWLASVSSSVFVLTTLVQAIVQVVKQGFTFPTWQYTLIMLAFLVITIGFCVWGNDALPWLEKISLFGHIGGWFVTAVVVLALAPKNSAKQVFTEVVNSSGWGNIGTSCLIVQVQVLYTNLGSDSAVHIAEEVKDSSLAVPRAMWWSFILNVVMGLGMLLVMLFCIGPLDAAVNADAPYLILFQNTGYVGVTLLLLVILLVLTFVGNITALATTSRELWAFARDKGFPCSRWLSKKNVDVPENSIYFTSIAAGILCLINFASSLAFEIIVSLTLLALLSTYMISIGCILLMRLQSKPLPPARWSLGRFGIPINAFAFFYCGFVIIFSCFPTELPVTTSNANWAPAVWVFVMVVAVGIYVVHGKEHYTAPVSFVEGKRKEGEALQAVE